MNEYIAGATSVVDVIFLQDSASTTGGGKTGLAYNTASFTCYYKRSNGTASVAVTLADISTLGTFTSGGFKAIDGTNMPGCYEFHPPDAAFASGAKEVTFFFQGASGLVPRPIKYRILGGLNVDDATRAGLTSLPTAAPAANGGLPTVNASNYVAGIQGTVNNLNNLDTAISTVAAYIDTEVAAIKAKTDNLPSDPADASDIAASFSSLNTKVDIIDDFLDTEIAAIKAKTDNLPSDPADASDIASSFSTVNATLSTLTGYVDTEVAAIKAKTDLIPASPASTGDVTGLLTSALTQDYAADGSTFNLSQALYMIWSALSEFAISGTTITCRKLDGSTTAMTFTLDSSSSPTSRTRAS